MPHPYTRLAPFFAFILILASCIAPAGTPSEPTPQVSITASISASEPVIASTSTAASRPTAPDPSLEPAVVPDAPGDQETPASVCQPPLPLTPSNPEGPYYKGGAPERSSLVDPSAAGTRLVLTGHVFLADCMPIPGAVVDFWQTDSQGAYDNAGFAYRGWQFTDETGAYRLETVLPGIYPGRTAHIHVKVRATGFPELTTQIYFEGVEANQSDSFVAPALVVPLEELEDGDVRSTFNFVIGK